MKKFLFALFAFTILVMSCKTENQSVVIQKANELSSLLDNQVFTQLDGIDDPEVHYITTIKQLVDDAAVRIIKVSSQLNDDSLKESSDFKLYVMQVLGLTSSITAIKDPFKEHTTFLLELLSSESDESKTSYKEIKRSLLNSSSWIEVLTTLDSNMSDYLEAQDSYTMVLTDVLTLLTNEDLAGAIEKMTGPEAQDYYLACLTYVTSVMEFEKSRAEDVIKAQEKNQAIN